MKTYSIGNSVNGIIRSYAAGNIGNVKMQYGNQPYTTFNGATASIHFKDVGVNLKKDFDVLAFNHAQVNRVEIKNIPLTEKILNLIYGKEEYSLCYKTINCTSSSTGIVYLPQEDHYYQVFVYNSDGELEAAFGEYTTNTIQLQPNQDYLIIYSYAGKNAFKFSSKENLYITLDLKVQGNEEDTTQDIFLHFDKCAVTADRELLLNGKINTVDLSFVVLDENNYIVLN